MNVLLILGFCDMVLGVLTVTFQIVAYVAFMGTYIDLAATGIWGGVAMFLTGVATRDNQRSNRRVFAITALISGIASMVLYIFSLCVVLPTNLDVDCSLDKDNVYCKLRTVVDVCFIVFGLLTVLINAAILRLSRGDNYSRI